MQKHNVKVGSTYIVKVSGTLARVRITREHERGGWCGINLATGREIRIRGMKSYFGTLDLQARSDLDRGRITIEAAMTGPSLPRRLLVRVPHPRHLRAAACAGGAYEPARELATVEPFTGSARLVLTF